MCLAVPGKIEKVFNKSDLLMGKVDFGGIKKDICLEYTPDAEIGSYVLVHVGFAINIINEDEAKRTLAMLKGSEDMVELEAFEEHQ